MSVPFVVELSTIVPNVHGEGNHCSIHSNILRSVCCVPSHHCLGDGMSSSRWVDSKNRRWESSHHSWRHGSGTAATHSANSLSQFGTIAYCSGGGEYSDQAAVERSLQAPRKPTRSESLERGFHMKADCHHGHSGQSHQLDKNDFGRTPPLILSAYSPKTTIRIRPPKKPVRQNSCEGACGTM